MTMSNYTIQTYSNSTEFLKDNEQYLINNESKYNLLLGLAYRGQKVDFGENSFFLSIKKDGEIVAQAARTSSDKPIMLTDLDDDSIKALISHIGDLKLAGVIGEKSVCDKFIELRGIKNANTDMVQGVYELKEVIMPNTTGLDLIKATDKDYDTCQRFLEGFILDCFSNTEDYKERAKEILERNLANEKIYLLINDKNIVSMAANVRSSKNGATVSLVYTPKEFRKNGYGSIVVALLSQKLLDSGYKMCNLFTDLSNPTSNSIYQKIGYKKIGESVHYKFL